MCVGEAEREPGGSRGAGRKVRIAQNKEEIHIFPIDKGRESIICTLHIFLFLQLFLLFLLATPLLWNAFCSPFYISFCHSPQLYASRLLFSVSLLDYLQEELLNLLLHLTNSLSSCTKPTTECIICPLLQILYFLKISHIIKHSNVQKN